MEEPNIEQFRKIFPEFSEIADCRIDFFMSQAKNQISTTAFGDSYAYAVYLVTAHILTISDPARAQNAAITSEKAGDLSVSYNVAGGIGDGFDEYRQTQYGLQYITLVKSCIMTVNVI